jgi:hypothetical protein
MDIKLAGDPRNRPTPRRGIPTSVHRQPRRALLQLLGVLPWCRHDADPSGSSASTKPGADQERLDAEYLERAAKNPIWAGITADQVPAGMTAAEAMMFAGAVEDALPRRQSVLEHALANEGVIEYHPIEVPK